MRTGLWLVVMLMVPGIAQAAPYSWLSGVRPGHSIADRISPPVGYERESVELDRFGGWLRGLPLLPGQPQVRLFDGRLKGNQQAHHAVVDIDVGARDLQQCADAVIRLRAEYLWSAGKKRTIQFDFTSGDTFAWWRWAHGSRPVVRGRRVSFRDTSTRDESYGGFRKYLDVVFTYAGTHSLNRELGSVIRPDRLRIGDVFVQGGSPGHAVIVLDVAVDPQTRKRVFLLGQSYMPAQQIQVLKNPQAPRMSPWYELDPAKPVITPEWNFAWEDLRRFVDTES